MSKRTWGVVASPCLVGAFILVIGGLLYADAAANRLMPGTYAVSAAEFGRTGDTLIVSLLRGEKIVVNVRDVTTEGSNLDGTYARVDTEVGGRGIYRLRSVTILLNAQKAEWDTALASARAMIAKRNSPHDVPPPKIVERLQPSSNPTP